MPVGKYYCDYCDKEFQDTPAARKRHLQCVHHQRNRAVWYDSHRQDLNQIPLATGTFGKGVCNRFVKTGFCPFGDSCKYHHSKHNLQGLVVQGASMTGYVDNMQLQVGGGSLQGHVASQNFGMSLGNLPPSLRPPPEVGYPSLPFVDWG